MIINIYFYISLSIFLISIYFYAYYLNLSKKTLNIAKKRNKKSAYKYLFYMVLSAITTIALALIN